MIVNAIYHGLNQVHRVYHGGQLIFQRDPIEFHVIEDEKLVIVGALSALGLIDGLYLDCAPEWVTPTMEYGVLTIEQAYTAILNGTTLEVE